MAGRDLSDDLFGIPAVPEPTAPSGKDLSADLFSAEPAPPAPKVAKPTTSVPNPFKEPAPAARDDFTFADPMGSDLGAAIMSQAEPDLGVMKNVPAQAPDKTAFTPIRPEVRRALIAEYDAASPAKRAKMETLLQGVAGDVIREYADKFKARQAKRTERIKKEVAGQIIPGLFEDLGTSVEERTARLIGEGEKPEFAAVAARQAAEADVLPGQEIKFMQAQGTLEGTDFDFEMQDRYRNANPLLRAGVAGYESYKQGALGVNQAVADFLGFDTFAKTQAAGAKESRTAVESMGQNPNYLARQFEGAVSSIAQQLPAMFGGVISGSEAFVLSAMFLQSFGQEYSEGKAKGLDGGEAATRAGLFGAFEVLGERFGLKFEMDNLRRAASGMKTDQLKDFLANTLKKELPGEYLTTTGQFLTDKSAIGLNKDATLGDYLQQLGDTTAQTIIQSGLMTGGTKLLEKGVSALPGQKPQEEEEPIPTAEQLMRERGFLQPTTKPVQEPVQVAPEAAPAQPTRIEPTLEETPEQRVAKRQKQVEEVATRLVETSGVAPEDAVKIAEGRVRAQEALEQKRQDQMQAEVEGRPTLIQPAEDRIQEITDDLIGAGMHPTEAAQRAVLMAQQEAENDALAEQEGAAYAGTPITEAGGVGAELPSAGAVGVPAGRTAEAVPAGLAPTGTVAGKPAARKGVQPSALDKARSELVTAERKLAQAQEQGNDWEIAGAQGVVMSARRRVEDAYNQEQEAQRGAETAEAVEAETQREEVLGEAPAPRKRGRPALAPEKRAESEQRRAEQRTAYKAVDKQVSQAERMLAEAAEPVDELGAKDDEQLKEMYENKRLQRNAAIRTLYDISKTNRGKPGQRALALLNENASTQEIKNAAEGHQLRKQMGQISTTGVASKAVEAAAAQTQADEKLAKVTNGAQALTQIIKTGNTFQKLLAKRLRGFVTNVKIVVVEQGQPVPEGIAKIPRYAKEWDRARALYAENYRTGERVVYVRGASFGDAQGVNTITMLHELLHAALNRKIAIGRNDVESGKRSEVANLLNDLVQIMNNAGDQFNELASRGRLPEHISKLAQYGEIFDDPREFVAYGMSDPEFQEFLKSAQGIGINQPFYTQFVNNVRNFFGMDDLDTNALADLIDVTESLLSAKVVGRVEGATPSLSTFLGDLFGGKKEPDTTESFAGQTTQARPTVNARRMAELLGAKLYGDPSDIAKVSIKELFQNAFDAIKGALEKGQIAEGKIDIKLNKDARTITITDNGLGMPTSVMGNQFLQIAGTVKETKRASGGLGIAKMLFLFGNKKLEVVSLRDGVLSRMVTTGEQIKNSFDDPSQAPSITTSTDPAVIKQYTESMFPDGHGTAVVVQIPETYDDVSTGEEKTISFDTWDLQRIPVLKHSPLFDNIEVTVSEKYGPEAKPIGKNFPMDEYTALANINFDWGTARIYIEKKEHDYMWEDNTHILSNGLWQFDKSINDRPGFGGKTIKRNFYIDVSPKEGVRPEDPGYPFELNRQGFAPSHREDFNKIFRYITAIYQQQSLADESKSFGQIQYVNSDGTLTEPEELVPEVPPTPSAFTMLKPDDKVEIRDGVMYVNGRAVPELTDEDLKKTSIRVDELTIPQDKIDTNRVMVHDNTIVKDTGKTLSERAREEFGQSYDKYIAGIGEIFMELRDALSSLDNGNYTDILKEAVGVSLDKEYYGVSIRVPFHGMYINPAITSLSGTPKQIAVSMIGTMIHEMAHHKIRGHNASFASEMQRIMNLLETHPSYDIGVAKQRLTSHIDYYQNIYDYLSKEFNSGNLEPRGNRFQDASAIEAGNEGFVEPMEGARAAGEEPGFDVSGWAEPSPQRVGKVGVGAGATSQAEEAGEQQQAVRTQKEVDREVAIALEKVRIGRQAEEAARQSKVLQALRDPRKILPAMKQVWKGASYAQRQLLVKLPTTEFLARWGSAYIPELMNTNVLLEKMGGLTQQLLNSSAILTQTIHKAFKEDKTLQKKLEDIAYTSTIAQVDPSDPNATERSKKLDEMYADLGAKGQQLYKIILQHYQDMSDYFAQLLDDQIANARLTTDAQNRLMSMVRKMYESGQKIKPYLPLVRRGDYWLAVGAGKHRQFFTFETMDERDKAAQEFANERRTPLEQLKEDQEFVLGNDIGSLRRASFDSSAILKSLFDIVDSEDFSSPDAKEELKDSIYQLYLTSMPEQSFRRQFINRKNITGFSTDLLRNISTTGVKMATQLSRLKYSPLLRNSLSAAQDSIVGREELQPFITEMQARINQQLNPGTRTVLDKTGDFLNRSAFIWYLSGASSALLQPVGVFQTGAPILLSRYGQINGSRELLKTLKFWDTYGVWRNNPDGTMSFVPPSMANAKGLSNDEKRAIREALGRDVTQSTYASALFGYKSTPTAHLGGIGHKTKRALAVATGGLMHSTERLSREMLFLASYRLNRAKLKKAGVPDREAHAQAVDQAVIDTNEALGNYGQYNRPLIMQKGLGKVALQFAMYPLHVTLFLMRNFKRMLPLLNKEGKWEASKIFFGTLGTTMVLAGASGLPMFSLVMGMLGWMWRDEDKPQELKDVDYETWWRTVWLPQTLGHIEIGGHKLSDIVDRGAVNALTGLDIASRTSLNDLWWRDTKETKTARDSVVALAMERAGPSASMILSLADAYEAFGNNNYQKGIEKMSPAMIRNFILTHKYATEGARDIKGADLILQGGFTTGELLGQSIGFRPEILSDPQQVAFKLTAAKQRIDIERTKILNNAAREYFNGVRTGNWDGYLKQLDKAEQFSLKYPEYSIDEDQIASSIDRREEQMATTEEWSGMPIDEKFQPYGADTALNVTERMEKRNREVLARRRKEKESK